MKYIFLTCYAFVVAVSLNSCGTTQAFAKAAYINNDVVHIPNEKATAITIIAVSFSSDKAAYEKAAGQIQSYLSGRNISSDMLFFDAMQKNGDINEKIKQSSKPYYLILDRMNSGTKKDELSMEMIFNEINCSLQKSSGERIADINIAMDRQTSASKLGKQIADLVTGYLTKKHLI
jgi:hypothetical protein